MSYTSNLITELAEDVENSLPESNSEVLSMEMFYNITEFIMDNGLSDTNPIEIAKLFIESQKCSKCMQSSL